jgi:hypothetical protein
MNLDIFCHRLPKSQFGEGVQVCAKMSELQKAAAEGLREGVATTMLDEVVHTMAARSRCQHNSFFLCFYHHCD